MNQKGDNSHRSGFLLTAAAVGILLFTSASAALGLVLLLKRGEHGVELGLEVGEVGLELRGRLFTSTFSLSANYFHSKMNAFLLFISIRRFGK